MAGGARGVHHVQEGVAVTVHQDLAHPQEVAGGVPLPPQGLAGPAEEVREPRLPGPAQGFLVRVRHHEDLAGAPVLHHHGPQRSGGLSQGS
jgi:hypothetical protein